MSSQTRNFRWFVEISTVTAAVKSHMINLGLSTNSIVDFICSIHYSKCQLRTSNS